MRSHSLLFVISLILLAAVSGCGKSADDLYSEGKTQILKKETVEKGLKTLSKFEKKYPDDKRTPEVVLALAMALQGEKRFDESIETYMRLINRYSDSAEAHKGMFLLGYMYYEDIKDNDKTIDTFITFIATYPDSELVTSAEVLIENIGLPVEEWSTVKKISSGNDDADSSASDK
ncbi:tol-pal system YbgF family protein [Candidatus Latescibacterota bacterium]